MKDHVVFALAAAVSMGLTLQTANADDPAVTPEPQPTTQPAKKASSMPEGAQRCVGLPQIRSTRVVDAQTILFEMGGKKTLANRLPRKCPGLVFEKRFAYRTSLNQLCNTDVITVITSIGAGASCGLGYFEPWVAPEQIGGQPGDGKLEAVKTPPK
jgi:hypothetical protein